jgi:hypothetical protein
MLLRIAAFKQRHFLFDFSRSRSRAALISNFHITHVHAAKCGWFESSTCLYAAVSASAKATASYPGARARSLQRMGAAGVCVARGYAAVICFRCLVAALHQSMSLSRFLRSRWKQAWRNSSFVGSAVSGTLQGNKERERTEWTASEHREMEEWASFREPRCACTDLSSAAFSHGIACSRAFSMRKNSTSVYVNTARSGMAPAIPWTMRLKERERERERERDADHERDKSATTCARLSRSISPPSVGVLTLRSRVHTAAPPA